MAQVLTQDTVWLAGSTIILSDEVQIAPGVTLTIEPGVEVRGGAIKAFGTLSALGTDDSPILFQSSNIWLSTNSSHHGRIDIQFAQLSGGGFLTPTGHGMYGSFSLTDSVVSAATTFPWSFSYIWYPSSDSVIARNVFLNSGGLSIGTDTRGHGNGGGNVIVEHNLFSGWASAFAIQNWAAYGDTNPIITGNAFISTDRVALRIQYESGQMDAPGNYFGTTDEAIIRQMIWDRNNDLNLNDIIDYSGFLDSAPESVPRSIFSFVSLNLPHEVIEEARLVGTGDAKLWGNALNNILIGNSGNNVLNGGQGVDTLVGGAGNDTLDGGPVPDPLTQGNFLFGGPGDDTYIVRNTYDLLHEYNYIPEFAQFGGGGFNTIIPKANWYWDVYGIGNKLIIDSEAHDPDGAGTTIIGGVWENELIGNAGTNIMFGRGGSDTYRPGDGIDYISFSLLGVPEDLYDGVRGNNTVILEARASGSTSYAIVFEFDAMKDKFDVSNYGYGSADAVFATGANDGAGNSYFALGDGLDYAYVIGKELDALAPDMFII